MVLSAFWSELKRYGKAAWLFNRPGSLRYFSIDLVIFGLPLVAAAPARIVTVDTVFALLSLLLARWGGFVLDDYCDREADRVNCPERVLPAGIVSARESLVLGLLGVGSSLFFASLVNVRFFVVGVLACLMLFFTFGVADKLKLPFLSTLSTISSVSLLSLLGWLVHGSLSAAAVLIYLSTWFWDLAHDTIGGHLDREGDAQADLQTVGVLLTRKQIAILSAGALVASYVAFVLFVGSNVVALFASTVLLLVTLRQIERFYRVPRPRADGAPVCGADVRKGIEWYVVGAYLAALGGFLLQGGIL